EIAISRCLSECRCYESDQRLVRARSLQFHIGSGIVRREVVVIRLLNRARYRTGRQHDLQGWVRPIRAELQSQYRRWRFCLLAVSLRLSALLFGFQRWPKSNRGERANRNECDHRWPQYAVLRYVDGGIGGHSPRL